MSDKKPTREQAFYEAMRIFTGDSREFDELSDCRLEMLRDAVRAFDADTAPGPNPQQSDADHDPRNDIRGPLNSAELASIRAASPIECLDRIEEFARAIRVQLTTPAMFPGGRILSVGYNATFVTALADQLARVCLGTYYQNAATAPDPGPPRPDDMAELARLVAVELRKRGIKASVSNIPCAISTPEGFCGGHRTYGLLAPDFDNLTPRECADVIQREEAARAAEWAGDT